MLPAALRVDIDTLSDVAALEPLLELLDRFEVRASFFVAMGPDRCGRNLRNYLLKPWKLLSPRVLSSYRLSHLLRTLVTPTRMEEHADELRSVLHGNHEVGLHGYDHYTWMRRLGRMSEEEVGELLRRGVESFRRVFGAEPQAFASPGFKTSCAYLRALDGAGFAYASDFFGWRVFYPTCNSWRSDTPQVPVCMPSPGEIGGDEEVMAALRRGLERAEQYFCFYVHPSHEGVLRLRLVERMLRYLSERCEMVPLSEIARRFTPSSASPG